MHMSYSSLGGLEESTEPLTLTNTFFFSSLMHDLHVEDLCPLLFDMWYPTPFSDIAEHECCFCLGTTSLLNFASDN